MLSFVLARRDFREHDQIITLYTLEQGKVEALARGVKKSISKNSPALEPFALIEADIVPGKEIAHLTTANIVEQYAHIHTDLAKLLVARYILSLVDELVDTHLPDKKIFALLHTALSSIQAAARVNTFFATGFAIQLGVLLGFSPVVDHCMVCGVAPGNDGVLFDIAGGGIVHTSCRATSLPTTPLSGAELTAFTLCMSGDLTVEPAREAGQNIGSVIRDFLTYHSQKSIPRVVSVDKLLA